MIEKFESFDNSIKKMWYIPTTDIPVKIIEEFLDNNPHNNGHAFRWEVRGLDETDFAYPEVNKFLLDKGLKVGEKVIIHSVW